MIQLQATLVEAYTNFLVEEMKKGGNITQNQVEECLELIEEYIPNISFVKMDTDLSFDLSQINTDQQPAFGSYRIDDIPLEVLREAFSLLDWDENPRLNTELLDRLNKANELLKPYLKS